MGRRALAGGLPHHGVVATLRTPRRLALLALLGLLAASLLALALGADIVSLALGGAIVATALVVVVVWPASAGRRPGRSRRPGRGGGTRGSEGRRGGGPGGRGASSAGREARIQGRRTAEAIEAAERRLFAQLEALDWLRDELRLAHPLAPTRGFAAAPDALAELVRLVDEVTPGQVVELGSGVSTIVLARRLQQVGRGRLTALEHLPEHAERTRAELARQGLRDVAEVVDAPLVDIRLGEASWRWYATDGLPDTIDLLFVDGPPSGTGPLARYPALPLLRERLTPGAAVLVDDGDRPDERQAVERWQAELPGLQVTHLALTKGAWLLGLPRS